MRRIVLRTLGAFIVVILALVAFVYARSELALRHTWEINETALAVPAGDEAVARGEHLAITRGCTDCHDKDLGG